MKLLAIPTLALLLVSADQAYALDFPDCRNAVIAKMVTEGIVIPTLQNAPPNLMADKHFREVNEQGLQDAAANLAAAEAYIVQHNCKPLEPQ